MLFYIRNRSDDQARDLAHCISYLVNSDKAMRRLQDNFSSYKDWLIDVAVYGSFISMLTKVKKFATPEVKSQVEEFERMIKEMHTRGPGNKSSTDIGGSKFMGSCLN